MFTTDDARVCFKGKGLDYSILRQNHLDLLMEFLSNRLKDYQKFDTHGATMGLILSEEQKPKFIFDDEGGLKFAEIKVDGSYFKNREGITFNKDGFIGFGGEFTSDVKEVFAIAFAEWCYEMSNQLSLYQDV